MAEHFLVSTEWLAARLGDPNVRILDVTAVLDDERRNVAEPDYLAEHLPGAVWFDVGSAAGELSDPDSPLSWTWPPLAQIEAAMGRVGVDNDTQVVLVARSSRQPYGVGTMWCTRAWWTLHHSGVTCAILAGGHDRWVAERRPTESGEVAVEPRIFVGDDRRAGAIADRQDVQAALADAGSCVIDALPAASFSGERVDYARPGHITGARNVPFPGLIREPTADFISEDGARAMFEAEGLFDRERAVLY